MSLFYPHCSYWICNTLLDVYFIDFFFVISVQSNMYGMEWYVKYYPILDYIILSYPCHEWASPKCDVRPPYVCSVQLLHTQVRSMCSWTLPCVSSLVPSVLHLSHGYQCSPTPPALYEGRLPLSSWWRKSSNMTVGQSSLISLAHHCYDWHPGSRCG